MGWRRGGVDSGRSYTCNNNVDLFTVSRVRARMCVYLVASLAVARVQAGGLVQIGLACRGIQTGLAALAQVSHLIFGTRLIISRKLKFSKTTTAARGSVYGTRGPRES